MLTYVLWGLPVLSPQHWDYKAQDSKEIYPMILKAFLFVYVFECKAFDRSVPRKLRLHFFSPC